MYATTQAKLMNATAYCTQSSFTNVGSNVTAIGTF